MEKVLKDGLRSIDFTLTLMVYMYADQHKYGLIASFALVGLFIMIALNLIEANSDNMKNDKQKSEKSSEDSN